MDLVTDRIESKVQQELACAQLQLAKYLEGWAGGDPIARAKDASAYLRGKSLILEELAIDGETSRHLSCKYE